MYRLMKLGQNDPEAEEEDLDISKFPPPTSSSLLTSEINSQRQQFQQQQLGTSPSANVHPIQDSVRSVTSPPKNLPPLHTIDIKQELLDPIINFYESKTNYDSMPNSGKVMVFDIDLPVRDAFYVAAVNG